MTEKDTNLRESDGKARRRRLSLQTRLAQIAGTRVVSTLLTWRGRTLHHFEASVIQ